MMQALPLTAHAAPDAVLAHRPDGPVTVAQFLADVAQVAARFPPGRHVFNVCADRYRFAVGLAAALASDRVSLLPANHAPETVRQLQAFAPDVFCLHEAGVEPPALPCVAYPRDRAPARAGEVPLIAASRTLAVLFTSGSTGVPLPHRRSFGAAVASARAEAQALALGVSHSIVGTVPPQHSYGLESTVMLALHGGGAMWHGRPFYPADIAAALARVPRPRLLVTTPFHLRALIDAGIDLPPLDLLLSATAPLSAQLARAAEHRYGAPVAEIYGCTESGQLASRRTTASARWQPLAGVRLAQCGGGISASGGHVEGEVPLADALELLEDGGFLLHGRSADMVDIAGKRTSLAHLERQIAAIAGVEDACFFLPEAAGEAAVPRLCCFVVAPGMDARVLQAALRERIDPVFLPRPLVFVQRLPRNATGKLPRAALQAMLDAHRGGAEEAA
jgi:acyl-coenzyme A synthetase/AMP-(fatty) acid ligase